MLEAEVVTRRPEIRQRFSEPTRTATKAEHRPANFGAEAYPLPPALRVFMPLENDSCGDLSEVQVMSYCSANSPSRFRPSRYHSMAGRPRLMESTRSAVGEAELCNS